MYACFAESNTIDDPVHYYEKEGTDLSGYKKKLNIINIYIYLIIIYLIID